MADATDTAAADAPEDAPEVDEARQAVLSTLADALGDALLDSHIGPLPVSRTLHSFCSCAFWDRLQRKGPATNGRERRRAVEAVKPIWLYGGFCPPGPLRGF